MKGQDWEGSMSPEQQAHFNEILLSIPEESRPTINQFCDVISEVIDERKAQQGGRM